ncbi:MAG: deoxynucleoside kinase [Bacteroidaceae bacterium]|jgi:deoxyadenosine/deoxycytidine kinase|nr:deoxynucleoside kinase [Bacteroidaceae bacterium]
MHIAIAGNIGSGKTTLTRMLAVHYGWKPQFEAVSYNPYLEDYYRDIPRWSFPMEVFFLKERFRNVLEIAHTQETIVQDRSIYEGVYVFAANSHRMGYLSDKDFQTFMDLFNLMTDMVRYPDLMIYLRAGIPHLVKNIQKRGRNYEQAIQLEYLKGLNDLYEDFILRKYKGRVLTIEVDDMDFQNNRQDFQYVTDKLDALVYGLFPLDRPNLEP